MYVVLLDEIYSLIKILQNNKYMNASAYLCQLILIIFSYEVQKCYKCKGIYRFNELQVIFSILSHSHSARIKRITFINIHVNSIDMCYLFTSVLLYAYTEYQSLRSILVQFKAKSSMLCIVPHNRLLGDNNFKYDAYMKKIGYSTYFRKITKIKLICYHKKVLIQTYCSRTKSNVYSLYSFPGQMVISRLGKPYFFYIFILIYN